MSHASQTELSALLTQAARSVTVGARYAHYKNKKQLYQVKAIVLLEETSAPAVVYQAEDGERITWIRPLASWLETVEYEGHLVRWFIKAEG